MTYLIHISMILLKKKRKNLKKKMFVLTELWFDPESVKPSESLSSFDGVVGV